MELKTNDQKTSYALGLQMAMQISQMPLAFDQEAFMGGFMDMMENNKPQITQDEFTTLMESLFKKIEEEHQHHCGGDCGCDGNCGGGCGGGCGCGDGAENAAAGDAFRAENAKKDGVETLASGLQIKMIRQGVGDRKPKATDSVKVHYTGKLIDGTVFDSSVERGEPLSFALNQVIPGWTEGVQHLTVGGKCELVIPPELGYGAQGAGGVIPPQATLIFEVELIDII